ncbi:hypothetical protein K7432_004146 [Basidiobolus ranarum]|uniref:Uncharacterized protein n=1 Tax=Basidiobolus ranarum TaxID=34480 RepID=A0ABR2W612_9FUNG
MLTPSYGRLDSVGNSLESAPISDSARVAHSELKFTISKSRKEILVFDDRHQTIYVINKRTDFLFNRIILLKESTTNEVLYKAKTHRKLGYIKISSEEYNVRHLSLPYPKFGFEMYQLNLDKQSFLWVFRQSEYLKCYKVPSHEVIAQYVYVDDKTQVGQLLIAKEGMEPKWRALLVITCLIITRHNLCCSRKLI